MQFLLKFCASFLVGFLDKYTRDAGSPKTGEYLDAISVTTLARAVFSRKHLWHDPLEAKAVAFEPRFIGATGRFELSTYCSDGLTEAQVAGLVRQNAGDRAQSLKALACFAAADVTQVPLAIDVDWQPERHVNIIGWSDSREGRLSQQQALAAKVARIYRPE